MKYLAVTLSMLCLSAGSANAQISFDVGADIGVAAPRGEFADNIERLGLGIAGHLAWYPGQYPIMVGADAGVQLFGTQSQEVRLPAGFSSLSASMETSSSIAQIHGMARIQPKGGDIRPFIEGLLGVNHLSTSTTFNAAGQQVASKTDQRDFSFSAGAGVGVDVRVVNDAMEGARKKDVYVSVGARYMFGGEADYVREEDITLTGGTLTYTTTTSRVDMLQFRVGVTFPF